MAGLCSSSCVLVQQQGLLQRVVVIHLSPVHVDSSQRSYSWVELAGKHHLAQPGRQVAQHELSIHPLPLLIVNVAVGLIHDLLLDQLFQAILKSDDAHRILT